MTATAVLFCGHGSRDPEAIAEFEAAAAGLRRRLSGHDFGIGYLEFSRPTIADGLAALAARGAGQICAVPGMLSAARHVKRDLPSAIDRFVADHRGIALRLARPLANAAELLDAASERIAAAAPGKHDDSALVVIGRGARDPAVNADLTDIARRLGARLGFAAVMPGFAGIAAPGPGAALRSAAASGCPRIVVFPYFLFTGILVKRIYTEIDRAMGQFPRIDFVRACHFGGHTLVLDALALRAEEIFRCDRDV